MASTAPLKLACSPADSIRTGSAITAGGGSPCCASAGAAPSAIASKEMAIAPRTCWGKNPRRRRGTLLLAEAIGRPPFACCPGCRMSNDHAGASGRELLGHKSPILTRELSGNAGSSRLARVLKTSADGRIAATRTSISALLKQHDQRRHHQDPRIQKQRPVFGVIDVVLDAPGDLLDRVRLAPIPMHLRPAGDPRLHLVAREIAPDLLRELFVMAERMRARADQ